MTEPRSVDDDIALIERRFNSFLYGEVAEDVGDATVEIRVRDIPSVRLSWIGADDIGRNITASVEPATGDFVFEINAWLDSGGNGTPRRWYHEELGPLSPREDDIHSTLSDAYTLVTNVGLDDLESAVDAGSAGASHLGDT